MPTKKKITGKLEIKSRKKRKQYSEGKSKTVSRTKKKHRGQNSWFKVEFGIAIETHTLDTLQVRSTSGSGALSNGVRIRAAGYRTVLQ